MASSTKGNRHRHEKQQPHRPPLAQPANLVAVIAVTGLIVIGVVSLVRTGSVPTIVVFGLIGSAVGAKFDDISSWIGGGKK